MLVKLDKELSEIITRVAKQHGQDIPKIVNDLLWRYCEDQYDYHEAVLGYAHALTSDKQGISIDALGKDLGVEHT